MPSLPARKADLFDRQICVKFSASAAQARGLRAPHRRIGDGCARFCERPCEQLRSLLFDTRSRPLARAMTSSREMDAELFVEDPVLNEICASHTRTRER